MRSINTVSKVEVTSAKKTYAFKQESNFGDLSNKVFAPKVVIRVAEELDEREESPPRVGTMDDEALQKNSSDNFLKVVAFDLCEEV